MLDPLDPPPSQVRPRYRDEPVTSVYRHWHCSTEGCDGEMKSLGQGITNANGTNWAHQCDKFTEERWSGWLPAEQAA